jgi:cyanophycin synthetase
MHLAPSEGLPRNVAAPVIDMLYPPGKSCRIPIIAVTGTNGKQLLPITAHILKTMDIKYLRLRTVLYPKSHDGKGDTTGPQSAQYILRDPTVEFAVLETARGGFYVLDWALVFVTLVLSLIFRKTIWE